MRVVSLLPAATEIVCALGARSDLVGVSHECDHPADVVGLPVLTAPRLAPASSRDIDRSVRGLVSQALAVYEVDTDLLGEVSPDVIVTQDLCDVCAVSYEDVCAAVAELSSADVRVVSLGPERLADVWSSIRQVGQALDREAAAEALIRRLDDRVRAVADRVPAIRPDVLAIEWIDPVMLGGLWMPDLIEAAGGRPLGPKGGDRAPTLDREALDRLDPDVVVVKPCGFPVARALAEIGDLPRVLPWDRWDAVREGRVYVADGNAYFNRPGPRIVDSLEILAACLHPDAFPEVPAACPDAAVRLDADLTVRPWGEQGART